MVCLVREIEERRAEDHRVMLIAGGIPAAEIYNIHRRRGSRVRKPTDYIKMPPKVVSAEEMEAALDQWMGAHNARMN